MIKPKNKFLKKQVRQFIKRRKERRWFVFIMKPLKGVTLCLTARCNLTCSYCRQKDYYRQICKQEDMSLDTALMSIKLVERRGKVSFFGGEPMTRFYLIKEIMEKNTTNCFSVISNGTADFKDYEWLFLKGKCSFTISYDGKNSDRGEESEDLAFVTIKKMIKIGANPRVRITLTPSSLEAFPQTIKELVNAGVKEVWFEVEDTLNLQEENFISSLLFKVQEAKEFHNDLILKNSALFSGYCDVRRGENVYVLPDGQIYLCHKDLSEETTIGNIFSSSLKEIHLNLKAKRMVESSRTLCFLQEKRKGWHKFSLQLKKILKGGDENMHKIREMMLLLGKMGQVSDALKDIGNRLGKIQEDLLKTTEEEVKNEKMGPNK